jgi:hypothetical protein
MQYRFLLFIVLAAIAMILAHYRVHRALATQITLASRGQRCHPSCVLFEMNSTD